MNKKTADEFNEMMGTAVTPEEKQGLTDNALIRHTPKQIKMLAINARLDSLSGNPDPVEAFDALCSLCEWISKQEYMDETMAYYIEHFYNQLGSGETPKMALALAKKCLGENVDADLSGGGDK